LELNSAGSWLFKGTPPHRNNEEEFQMHAQNLLALASVLALTGLLAACGATTKMIMIKSSPDEAEVSIAGKVVGSTPVEQYKLEFKDDKEITLLVQKDFYLPFSAAITNDGKKEQTFEAVLIKVADVHITSTPAAQVFAGEELVGTTPLDYRLVFNAADNLTLTLKAEGYQDLQQNFAIDGPDNNVLAAKLDPLTHTETVFFDTDPQGATITMGYEYLCDTPCEIQLDDMNSKIKPQLKIERRGFSSKLINLEYKGLSWRDRNYPQKMKILLAPAAGNEAYDAKALGINTQPATSNAPMIIAPMMSGSQPAPQQPTYYPQAHPQQYAPQQQYAPAPQQQYAPQQQQYVSPQPLQQQPVQPPVQQPIAPSAQGQPDASIQAAPTESATE
tara:strand:+ start:2067 stop:3230 length:1164 start_codon:yes stop_codon:yes gene_type:complete